MGGSVSEHVVVRMKTVRVCECGCGGHVVMARFLRGHNFHVRIGALHPNWKGGVVQLIGGYVGVLKPEHPRASTSTGYVREHILVAEHALGRPLPPKAQVHHVNRITHENAGSNLVICQDNAYHSLLHQRQRAYEACGHAEWRRCPYCKQYDDPANMWISKSYRRSARHRSCQALYDRLRIQVKVQP